MRDKGAATEVQVLVHELPEIIAEQKYSPAADEHIDSGGNGDNDWEDQASNEHEVEMDETEVEKTARKVEYQDFCTWRDHINMSNKHWGKQTEGMVDAYMDWCLRERTGEALPECDKSPLWIDIVDVFNRLFLQLQRKCY